MKHDLKNGAYLVIQDGECAPWVKIDIDGGETWKGEHASHSRGNYASLLPRSMRLAARILLETADKLEEDN